MATANCVIDDELAVKGNGDALEDWPSSWMDQIREAGLTAVVEWNERVPNER